MFYANGAIKGTEFQVNTVTTDNQIVPAVATFSTNDNSIITWIDYRSYAITGDADIWAQLTSLNCPASCL